MPSCSVQVGKDHGIPPCSLRAATRVVELEEKRAQLSGHASNELASCTHSAKATAIGERDRVYSCALVLGPLEWQANRVKTAFGRCLDIEAVISGADLHIFGEYPFRTDTLHWQIWEEVLEYK